MSTETDVQTQPTQAGAIPSGEWIVDPARSRVHFHTRAMFGLFPVLGRFERFDGVLQIDEAGDARGELRIDTESIRTGIGKRDAHLRTEDFFHAQEYPHVTFQLEGLEGGPDGQEVSGALRIREKTLPVRATADVASAARELRIRTRLPIDHDAAGLGWAKPGMVRKTVEADVELTLTPKDGDQ